MAVMEDRVMDALMEYPQTSADLADQLGNHPRSVNGCIRELRDRGLVQPTGKYGKHVIWAMARTRKAQ